MTPQLIPCESCNATGRIQNEKCDDCWGSGSVSKVILTCPSCNEELEQCNFLEGEDGFDDAYCCMNEKCHNEKFYDDEGIEVEGSATNGEDLIFWANQTDSEN